MFNYLQRFLHQHKYRNSLTSNRLYDIPELNMVNTRAILWFMIVFDFLPGKYNIFRRHCFTIRDVLALKVFVQLNSYFLSFSPAFLSWPARLSRRPSAPLGSRKRLSRLQFTHSYQMFQCSLSCVRYKGPKGGQPPHAPLNCHLVNDHTPLSWAATRRSSTIVIVCKEDCYNHLARNST